MTEIRGPVWAAFVAIFMLTACGSKHDSKSVQPPKDIQDSFIVKQQPPAVRGDLAVDKFLVGINKKSLEKEFLMRAEIISQTLAPSFQGLKSRIIAFREHGDELLMLEATKGHLIDPQTPSTLLLAKFKVVREVDEVIYFDLNEGFSNLFMVGDWYGSDESRMYDDTALFQSTPFVTSYIDEAKFDSSNQLIVGQVGQLKMKESNAPTKVKYYFTTYQPDPNFKKVETGSDFTHFGYFEVNPTISEHGVPNVYATHFSLSKPIVYAVSENTPADFKAAVREGVLYWNKAFGREVIQVVDAPKGDYAPNAEINIVQWVNFDWAGAAYADAQMDPRTGQTMHAQVFMTSAFAVGGKAAARRLLKQIAAGTRKPAHKIGLKGFASSSMCNRTIEKKFAQTVAEIVSAPDVTDETVLRAAQDYVRDVVAHEVGHTLGLRHNFAGSLYANFKPADHPRILKDYLLNATVDPTLMATSSVMDYDGAVDALVTGHQLKHVRNAMVYDEMAIRHLYDGISYSRAETPPFCTDSSMGKFADCMVWDSGPSALESAVASFDDRVAKLPDTIMQIFVEAKSPTPGFFPVPVERVALPQFAGLLAGRGAEVLSSFEKDSRFLMVERQFPYVDSTNEEAVRAKKLEYVSQEIARLGGLKKLMEPWSNVHLQALLANTDKMIDSGKYDKGIDENNNQYQFTSSEMEVIRARTKQALIAAFEKVPEAELKALTEWKAELAEHALSDEYADILQQRAEELVLATTGATITGNVSLKDGSQIAVTLPVFKYKHSVRKGAYELLKRDGKPSLEWGYAQREIVKGKFGKVLDFAFHDKWEEVSVVGMSREVLRWYLENKEIYDGMDDVQEAILEAVRNAGIKAPIR